MEFRNQNLLLSLFGLVPLSIFLLWYFRRKERLLERFAARSTLERLFQRDVIRIQKHKAIAMILVIALLIIVMAGPQYGTIERPVTRKGVDIYITLDTSASMYANDIQPSRIERAKSLMRSLLYRLRGDRVGIIIFAATAFIQCPLTVDYDMALNTLNAIDVGVVPVQGTALGTTIQTAVKSFARTPRGYRILVLITDGEDQGTDPITAAKEATKEGVVIYCIGIGSTQGAPIPLPDGGFKEDKEGHKVMSKLDFTTLQNIALETGGKAVLANPTGDAEVATIYNDIQTLRKRELDTSIRTYYEDRFQYFLLPAIILLFYFIIKPERRTAKRRIREDSV